MHETNLIENWQIVFQHRVFHVMLNVYDSEGKVFHEDEIVKPFYFVIALKVWPEFLTTDKKKVAPTGLLLVLNVGGGDTKEEVEQHAIDSWKNRVSTDWYAEYLSILRNNVRPKFLTLIPDFKNSDTLQ